VGLLEKTQYGIYTNHSIFSRVAAGIASLSKFEGGAFDIGHNFCGVHLLQDCVYRFYNLETPSTFGNCSINTLPDV
jgi:hypothetical protein